jgi:SpoVK/Ycf46/Vps4 family AAA+-type ATPase
VATSRRVASMIEKMNRDDTAFSGRPRSLREAAQRKRLEGDSSVADQLEALMAPVSLTAGISPILPQTSEGLALVKLYEPSVSLNELVLAPNLKNLIDVFLKEHRSADLLGAKGLTPRRRLLLAGPSGTGKSQTAEAIAASLGLFVAKVRLSTIVSSYLGETAQNIDQVLRFAERANCVLLFDELDMLASERSENDHGEMRRVVASILQLLEDFDSSNLIIATTNHSRDLDSALWRRFDEVGIFEYPEREQIVKLVEIKLRRFKSRLNKVDLTKSLKGFSQAEIELVCLDAARSCVLEGRTQITTADLSRSADSRRGRLDAAGRLFS